MLGARIEIGSKLGYTAVLTNKAKEIADYNNGFNIQYGFDLRNNADVFIGSVANQVQNIPNHIDYLVITSDLPSLLLAYCSESRNITSRLEE